MNAMKNQVQLIGNLGTDPDVKQLDGGKSLARFSLATNETYRNNKGEQVKETQWHNIVAWGKTAELVEKLVKKGSEVAVTGKLTSRSWEDKQGQKRYITEVVMNEFLLIGSRD